MTLVSHLTVVKIGGSLYDLPDLAARLQRWLARLQCASVLLVPGGGPRVRALARAQSLLTLDDETAHWLAVRALRINATYLASLLGAEADSMASSPSHCRALPCRHLAILDCYKFLIADEGAPACLPHSWAVTSDSIAARAAHVEKAAELILLKSIDVPSGLPWREAARQGHVDAYFPRALERAARSGVDLQVRAVNLRNEA